ncbi:MAG: aspartyl/asparaginyl beta-hydroxylase domain-containing protein [Phenylobacterium sp.]
MSGPSDSLSSSDPQAIWSGGARALREGRPAEALAAFEQVLAGGEPTATIWVGLGMARGALGDTPGAIAALQAALALEPRNPHALMQMADVHAAAGDARAASTFYDTVVKLAAAPGAIGPAFHPEVARAERMREQFAGLYEGHLRAELAAAGVDGQQARRVRRALDLLLGKAQRYEQEPKGFYFPELPNVEYAERTDFPWLDRIEAATAEIRAELTAVLQEDGAFAPYVEAEPNRPFFDDHGMLGNPSWSAFYLIKGGERIAENAARCPATLAALAEAPLCEIPGRTPSVLFSLLRPGAHIQPHHGFTNARFVCHLPLIVPEGCAMRVGSETRAWREGEACVFDDSIEHEAWNRNPDRLRVVLIFDVWRPELSLAERGLVTKLLQAVDRFGALPEAD